MTSVIKEEANPQDSSFDFGDGVKKPATEVKN